MQPSPRRAFLSLALPTLLLASVAAFPSSAQETPGPPLYEFTDSAGDVQTFLAPNPGTPPTAATDPYDLLAFRITSETTTQITVEVQVADLNGATDGGDFTGFTSHRFLEIQFGVEGHASRFAIQVQVYDEFRDPGTPAPTGPISLPAQLCALHPDYGFCAQSVDIPAEARFADNVISATFPKGALMGQGLADGFGFGGQAGPIGFPKTLEVGTGLGPWLVHLYFELGVRDSAPDVPPAQPWFRLTQPTANTKLKLSLGLGDWQGAPVYSVPIGHPTPMPIIVENTMQGKRLVNLTARIEGTEKPDAWAILLPPTLEVPSTQSRYVQLLANGSAQLAHRDTARLVIEARSLGRPDELGSLVVTLVASVPPSEKDSILHFHAALGPTSGGLCFNFDRGLGCYGDEEIWMNTLATDPLGTHDAGLLAPYSALLPALGAVFSIDLWNAYIELDTPQTEPLFFDAAKPIQVSTAWQARAAFEASLSAMVIMGETLIGEAEAPIQIGTSATPSTINVAISTPEKRLGPGMGRLAVLLRLRSDDPAAVAASHDGLTFVPAQSTMTLPLLPNPEPSAAYLGAGAFAISALNETEDFVNPGRTALFEAQVTNQGLQGGEVRLDVTASAPTWSSRVAPSDRYQLEPGQAIVAAVLVKAPSDAVEGAVVHIQVAAYSGETKTGSVNFTLIVTKGADLPDEEGQYQADPEALAHAVGSETKGTPAPGAVLVLAALLVHAVRRRLRRS